MNQSNNQSVNQLINQSVSQSISQSQVPNILQPQYFSMYHGQNTVSPVISVIVYF